ncbi:MAG: hypothetical protein QOE51_4324 [Actinoplanes sp.]|nr:hypothetical protein [Actinoplanes sp.]
MRGVDDAAEVSPASYRSIRRDHDGRVVVGWQLLPALMRAVIVDVVQVLADHRKGVSLVVDQQTRMTLGRAAPAER